jgi:hypothetical protein
MKKVKAMSFTKCDKCARAFPSLLSNCPHCGAIKNQPKKISDRGQADLAELLAFALMCSGTMALLWSDKFGLGMICIGALFWAINRLR